jgi:hypothetical protein
MPYKDISKPHSTSYVTDGQDNHCPQIYIILYGNYIVTQYWVYLNRITTNHENDLNSIISLYLHHFRDFK